MDTDENSVLMLEPSHTYCTEIVTGVLIAPQLEAAFRVLWKHLSVEISDAA